VRITGPVTIGGWLLCFVLITGTSACSFATVRAPHAATTKTDLDCESISPTLDAVGAVIGLGAAAALGYAAATTTGSNAMGTAYAAMFLGIPAGVIGATYGASGIYGALTLARCRRLEREQQVVYDLAPSTTKVRVQALVDDAAAHAREGRCERAAAIAREVRTLYPDYYVLIREESAITRCVD
jgi:hypothetical protein